MSIRHRFGGIGIAAVVCLIGLGCLASCSVGGQAAKKAKPAIAGCTGPSATVAASPQSQLARRACQAAGNQALAVQTVYSAQDTAVKITITVGGAVPLTKQQISAATEMTKTICRQEQQAMWVSGVSLKEVRVIVMGPTQDEYADIIAQVYGSVVLDAATAAHLDWASLSADSAWNRYDTVYLRPTFDVVDDLPAAP